MFSKSKWKARFPLKEIRLPLKETRFPLKETRFPLNEIRFPLKETRLPLKEIRFPIKEIRFPLKETCFCQANVDLLCPDFGWFRFGDIRNFDMNRFLMHSMWWKWRCQHPKFFKIWCRKNVGVEKNKRPEWSVFARHWSNFRLMRKWKSCKHCKALPGRVSMKWKRNCVFKIWKNCKNFALQKNQFSWSENWCNFLHWFSEHENRIFCSKNFACLKCRTVWAVYNTYSL